MNGIERLSEMVKDQKDKYLQIIVNHLMLQTEMSEAFLNEEKDLKGMSSYIQDLAKKQATNNVAVIEDAIVFNWAKDYFNKSNEELGIKKKEVKINKTNNKENIITDDEFGSIFDLDNSNKNIENKKEEIEQITLFAA